MSDSSFNDEIDIAERKAWDALARYKFMMFGYWAAIWVHLNRISGQKRENPWRDLVREAKVVIANPCFEPIDDGNELEQLGLEI